MKQSELITDEELKDAFENTNFGSTDFRGLINKSLIQHSEGYYSGHTIMLILIELGLIVEQTNLTVFGHKYLKLKP